MGEHSDVRVFLWSCMTVVGILAVQYCAKRGIPCDDEVRNILSVQTRDKGSRIIVVKVWTHYGIATCVCHIVDAIIDRWPMVALVSSTLMREHGCWGVVLSVSCVVRLFGVQRRICERWTPEEYHGVLDAAEVMQAKLRGVSCR